MGFLARRTHHIALWLILDNHDTKDALVGRVCFARSSGTKGGGTLAVAYLPGDTRHWAYSRAVVQDATAQLMAGATFAPAQDSQLRAKCWGLYTINSDTPWYKQLEEGGYTLQRIL